MTLHPDTQDLAQAQAPEGVRIEEAPTYVDTPEGTATRVVIAEPSGYLPTPVALWEAVQAGSYAVVLVAVVVWVRYGGLVATAIRNLSQLNRDVQGIAEQQQKVLEDLVESLDNLTQRIDDLRRRNNDEPPNSDY